MVDIPDLIARARSAKRRAKAPHSGSPVGAALLTDGGKIYSGCNIESSAFPTTICAERVAIFGAIAAGERDFKALAMVSNDGGMPCGACRQVIHEQCGEIPIYVADPDDDSLKEFSISQLLPYPFDLNKF